MLASPLVSAWNLHKKKLPGGDVIIRSISAKVFDHEEEGVVDIGVRFDVNDSDGRFKETIIDRSRLALLTVDQVRRLLGDAGFEVIAVYSSFTQKPWSIEDDQAIFNTKLAKV